MSPAGGGSRSPCPTPRQCPSPLTARKPRVHDVPADPGPMISLRGRVRPPRRATAQPRRKSRTRSRRGQAVGRHCVPQVAPAGPSPRRPPARPRFAVGLVVSPSPVGPDASTSTPTRTGRRRSIEADGPLVVGGDEAAGRDPAGRAGRGGAGGCDSPGPRGGGARSRCKVTGKGDQKSTATELAVVWRNQIGYLPDPARNGAMGPGLIGQMFLYGPGCPVRSGRRES